MIILIVMMVANWVPTSAEVPLDDVLPPVSGIRSQESYICPCAHHPSPVLIDLQAFDVDPGEDVSYSGRYHHRSDPGSSSHVAPKGAWSYNERPYTRESGKDYDHVAIDSVEDDGLVAHCRDKLETDLYGILIVTIHQKRVAAFKTHRDSPEGTREGCRISAT